jgi:ribosomal protein L37AE/L43A
MALRKRPFIGTQGGKDAKDNLSVGDEGDCARCGGDGAASSLTGYLSCVRCNYEWKDPSHSPKGKAKDLDSIARESRMVDKFRAELESGTGISNVLGIDQRLSEEQEQSLGRLQGKWIDGMHGHYNAAEDERKPLIINFDDEDNIIDTDVAKLTIVNNDFDGGEEVRIEYPGLGTEFYAYDSGDGRGWRRGRDSDGTARNIAAIINRESKLVHAYSEGEIVIFELRDSSLDPKALVLYVDDPGEKDLVAEKDGVTLDPAAMSIESDYQAAVELMLSDGIITPSEDQLLWAMRQHLSISEERHMKIILTLFGDDVKKECTGCGEAVPLYTEHDAWYCSGCEMWV